MRSTAAKAVLLTVVTVAAVTHHTDRPGTASAPPAADTAAVVEVREGLPPHASRSRIVATPKPKPAVVTPKAVKPRTAPQHRTAAPARTASKVTFSTLELRVRACETGPNGWATHGRSLDADYTAQDPRSTASGAWSFLRGTWGGFMGYSQAYLAPPSVQDLKARRTIDEQGLRPWAASRSCWDRG